MLNSVINIPNVEPVRRIEFVRHVLQTYDRAPDKDYYVRACIEEAFNFKMGNSIKEFVFKNENSCGKAFSTIFLGSNEDIIEMYKSAYELRKIYHLLGDYPDKDYNIHTLVGIISTDGVNDDMELIARLFGKPPSEVNPWDFYNGLSAQLYLLKSLAKKSYTIMYDQITNILGYEDRKECEVPVSKLTEIIDQIMKAMDEGKWATVSYIVAKNYNPNFDPDVLFGCPFCS